MNLSDVFILIFNWQELVIFRKKNIHFFKLIFCSMCNVHGIAELFSVLRSRSRKESHLLVGAGAVTRCGSGSDGFDNGITHTVVRN
jgi:hypothetical protein